MSHLIRQIGQLTLVSPDPDVAARDVVDIVGLRIASSEGGGIFLTANERQHELVYTHGPQGRMLAMGLEAMNAEAVAEVKRRVVSEGLTIIDDKPLWGRAAVGFRFQSSFGPVIEVHTPVPRVFPPRQATGSRPTRLEHTNFRVSDTRAFGELLERLFGMRLSDRTEGFELAWYRTLDGYHHTIAVGQGEPTMHHYAFDANSLEHLAGIADRLVQKKRSLLWGPGRHGAGDNIFTYYLDPDGCAVENSVELARIDCDDVHEPGVWALDSDVRNLWGVASPADFGRAGILFLE